MRSRRLGRASTKRRDVGTNKISGHEQRAFHQKRGGRDETILVVRISAVDASEENRVVMVVVGSRDGRTSIGQDMRGR